MSALERASSIGLSAAALIIAVALAHREFTPTATATPAASGPPAYVKQWRTLLAIGVPIGNPDAEIKIVEFADFECPFCRHADSVFKAVRSKHPSLVGVYFVHFPLRMHRFARLAARSAECAYGQGQFAAMHDVLFQKQDSFGLKSWVDYARDAGVVDTAEFAKCMASHRQVPRIREGVAAGEKLGIRGTPTVLINGWKFPRPPTEEQLDSAVAAIVHATDGGQGSSP